MRSRTSERGAALILLIGITATLAILSSTLVMVIANQEHATAAERTRKTSQANAEGALDTAINVAKTKTFSTTDSTWLTPTELLEAYKAGFDGGVLPEGMSVEFFVYDNSSGKPAFDANGDSIMWIEVVLTYQGKTNRMRAMIRQTEESVISALPKAVVYSDSGISLEGTSDVYAVKDDGVTPWPSAPPWATTVMGGGGWVSGMPAGAKNFTANATANLAAPTSTAQSVNIQVNGAVSPSGKFAGTIIGGVGLLSDYFNQAAQADLVDEAKGGEFAATAPIAPTAPAAPISTGTTVAPSKFTTQASTGILTISGVTYTAATMTYTFPSDISISGSLTLKSSGTAGSAGVFPAGTKFKFQKVYLGSTYTLTVTDNISVSATSLRVGGALAINNTTNTAVTDSFTGPVYVAGTSASSVAGRVALSATSLYTGGALTLSNTSTSLGQLYSKGALGLTGTAPVTVSTSAYTGGALTISGATSAITDQFGSLYVAGTGSSAVSGLVTLNSTGSVCTKGPLTMSNTAVTSGGLFYVTGNLALTGNITAKTRDLVVLGGSSQTDTDFAITGSTTPVIDQFGSIWVKGTSTWSGYASVRTTDHLAPAEAPAPMYLGILNRSGTFNDVYGFTWCVGNAGTANVAVNIAGPASGLSTIMCPLLATTEKTTTSGKVRFGSMLAPMVYYMVCDNDTLYSNTCDWGSSETFYGLMLVMEACLRITGGNGITPCVVGAVFNGTPYKSGTSPSVNDITLTGASTVAYSHSVIDAIIASSIRTTTIVTQIVPGSWQHLPAN